MKIPVIETDRLVLEPLSAGHSRGMFDLWSDQAVCRFSGAVRDYDGNVIPMPARSRNDSDAIIDFWRRAVSDGWGFRWAVVLLGGQRAFAGMIGFNSWPACAEIAYHLHPSYWGKGIMTEAAKAATQWARVNGACELEAFIEPKNVASIALARRLGMTATHEFCEGARRYLVSL